MAVDSTRAAQHAALLELCFITCAVLCRLLGSTQISSIFSRAPCTSVRMPACIINLASISARRRVLVA
ncbi:hypothetical protein WJX81_000115 [Elliptochloris bilobata]|uniref:Secreted protein n=1 Tax=Elliptochloris bilobata TaxID=381761 RepID=A0AAW1R0E0_9CHLO